jgi:hypothetical protein
MLDWFQWIFFGPSQLIKALPYAGFAIGAVLVAWQFVRSYGRREVFTRQWFRHAAVFTGLLWMIFNLYETQMIALDKTALAAGKQAIFRLDMIVIAPLLYVLTTFSLWMLTRRPAASTDSDANGNEQSQASETDGDKTR